VNGGFWHKFGTKMRCPHGRVGGRRAHPFLREIIDREIIDLLGVQVRAGMEPGLQRIKGWDDEEVGFSGKTPGPSALHGVLV
jgi:hypothetical protein